MLFMSDTEIDDRELVRAWMRQVLADRPDMKPTQWAAKAGIAATSVTRHVNPKDNGYGDSVPKPATIRKLAEAAGVPPPAFAIEAYQPAPPATDNDRVKINHLDIRFGMGGGAHYDAPVEAKPMSFSRSWISQLTNAKPENLFWASGFGDSMYPTIGDRDLVLVDTSQKEPRIRDQIWALNQYGQGMIKRLRTTPEGYLILSDNPAVPDDVATDGSMEIVGRVVAIIRRV